MPPQVKSWALIERNPLRRRQRRRQPRARKASQQRRPRYRAVATQRGRAIAVLSRNKLSQAWSRLPVHEASN